MNRRQFVQTATQAWMRDYLEWVEGSRLGLLPVESPRIVRHS